MNSNIFPDIELDPEALYMGPEWTAFARPNLNSEMSLYSRMFRGLQAAFQPVLHNILCAFETDYTSWATFNVEQPYWELSTIAGPPGSGYAVIIGSQSSGTIVSPYVETFPERFWSIGSGPTSYYNGQMYFRGLDRQHVVVQGPVNYPTTPDFTQEFWFKRAPCTPWNYYGSWQCSLSATVSGMPQIASGNAVELGYSDLHLQTLLNEGAYFTGDSRQGYQYGPLLGPKYPVDDPSDWGCPSRPWLSMFPNPSIRLGETNADRIERTTLITRLVALPRRDSVQYSSWILAANLGRVAYSLTITPGCLVPELEGLRLPSGNFSTLQVTSGLLLDHSSIFSLVSNNQSGVSGFYFCDQFPLVERTAGSVYGGDTTVPLTNTALSPFGISSFPGIPVEGVPIPSNEGLEYRGSFCYAVADVQGYSSSGMNTTVTGLPTYEDTQVVPGGLVCVQGSITPGSVNYPVTAITKTVSISVKTLLDAFRRGDTQLRVSSAPSKLLNSLLNTRVNTWSTISTQTSPIGCLLDLGTQVSNPTVYPVYEGTYATLSDVACPKF